jgi:hypothetical protein
LFKCINIIAVEIHPSPFFKFNSAIGWRQWNSVYLATFRERVYQDLSCSFTRKADADDASLRPNSCCFPCGTSNHACNAAFWTIYVNLQVVDSAPKMFPGGSMSSHPEMQPLEVRIERLERQNRLFRRGALTCLIGLVSVGLMGQTKHPRKAAPTTAPAAPVMPEKIEAGSFILKDSNGKTRAELSMAGTGPTFKLRDESGTPLSHFP